MHIIDDYTQRLNSAFNSKETIDDDLESVYQLYEYIKKANVEEIIAFQQNVELVEILNLIYEFLETQQPDDVKLHKKVDLCLLQITAIKSYIPNTQEYIERLKKEQNARAREAKSLERELRRIERIKNNFLRLLLMLKVIRLKSPPRSINVQEYLQSIPNVVKVNDITVISNISLAIQSYIEELMESTTFKDCVKVIY